MKRQGLVIVVALVLSFVAVSLCLAENMGKEQITDKAKQALANKGIVLEDVNIVYDEGNKQWEAWGVIVAQAPADANHGLLPHGVLENKKYQAIYFDFIDDAKKDIWLFADPETGEVLAIYEKK